MSALDSPGTFFMCSGISLICVGNNSPKWSYTRYSALTSTSVTGILERNNDIINVLINYTHLGIKCQAFLCHLVVRTLIYIYIYLSLS